MLPYPPSIKTGAPERSLLRVLGGVLASLSILLALLGIIFYQHVVDLILAIIVETFAMRVLLIWMGNKPQHQQSLSEWSPRGRHSIQVSPYSQSRSPSQFVAKQHIQQPIPAPPILDAPSLSKLPRSVRPQRTPETPMFPAQPVSAPPAAQPPSLWSPPLPAPASGPSRQEIWQYDDEKI